MYSYSTAFFLTFGTFLGMCLLFKLGCWIGDTCYAKLEESKKPNMGAAESAIFGLLALLIGFTFSNAYGRYDNRFDIMVQEITDISTAYARLDVLPEPFKGDTQALLKEYTESRIKFYARFSDPAKAKEVYESSIALQDKIWDNIVAFCSTDAGRPYSVVLMNPFNSAFDTATIRTAALYHHVPILIFLMLVAASLLASLITGLGSTETSKRNMMQIVLFAFVTSMTIYVIYDLESPRGGLIQISADDHLFKDLQPMLNEE